MEFLAVRSIDEATADCTPLAVALAAIERLQSRLPDICFKVVDSDIPPPEKASRIQLPDCEKDLYIIAANPMHAEMVAVTIEAMLPQRAPCRTLVNQLHGAKSEWEFIADRLPVEIYLTDEHFLIRRLNLVAARTLNAAPAEAVGTPLPPELVGGNETLLHAVPACDEEKRQFFLQEAHSFYGVHVERIDRGLGRHGFLIMRWNQTVEISREKAQLRMERLAGLGEIAMGLAHEFNNPLEVIWVAADALERKLPGDEKGLRYVEMIREEASRCRRLTHDLLAFGRLPDRGFEAIGLHGLLETLPGRIAADRRVKLELICQAWVNGNQDDLLRLFVNLLTNAVQASPEGSEILIRLQCSGDGYVLASVTNEGPEIPPDMSEKIYRPFVTGSRQGTGLGLAFASRIVSMKGGRIWHEHQNGKTTFFVRLPALRENT